MNRNPCQELKKHVKTAKQEHPILLNINFLPDDQFDGRKLTPPDGFKLFEWNTEVEEYIGAATDIHGMLTVYTDRKDYLRAMISLRDSDRRTDRLCGASLFYLFHELGHLDDLEQEINFDVDCRTFNAVQGEIYADIFAFRKLLDNKYYGLIPGILTTFESVLNDPFRMEWEKDVARQILASEEITEFCQHPDYYR